MSIYFHGSYLLGSSGGGSVFDGSLLSILTLLENSLGSKDLGAKLKSYQTNSRI